MENKFSTFYYVYSAYLIFFNAIGIIAAMPFAMQIFQVTYLTFEELIILIVAFALIAYFLFSILTSVFLLKKKRKGYKMSIILNIINAIIGIISLIIGCFFLLPLIMDSADNGYVDLTAVCIGFSTFFLILGIIMTSMHFYALKYFKGKKQLFLN